jgi:hypothetical protein
MRKILIVIPLSYFASIPFLMEMIKSFVANGFYIDILTVDELDPCFSIQDERISIKYIEKKRTFVGRIRHLYEIVRIVRKLDDKCKYKMIFGCSQMGVITTWFASLFSDIRYIYLNDELWFNDFVNNIYYYPLKCAEIAASRNAVFTITQDKMRGKLLSRINNLDFNKLKYLPNSRVGCGIVQRSYYLHEMIGCSLRKKIILWIGAVSEGDGALELVEQSNEWPDDYILVFHFRSQRLTPYKEKIMAYHKKMNVHVLTDDFSYDELPAVFSSAYIGVAYYPDRGINARYIGHSSGKINSFLQHGVPCVVSDLIGLHWVRKTGSGVCVKNISEVSQAISIIEGNYKSFSKSAVSAFDSLLSIDDPMSELVDLFK